MLLTIDPTNRITERVALRAMFEARKEVFVDLLKWDLPVLDGQYEVDQFDDGYARYIVVLSPEGRHLGSARLLPTTRPCILGSLFPQLVSGVLPDGPDIYEITRFCLSRNLRAAARRDIRNQLISALARFALANGISSYTGVAEAGWYSQILSFGWDCRPLGLLVRVGDTTLGALQIHIDGDTIGHLVAAGVYAEPAATLGLDHAA